jgi:hypothetical protein
LNKWNTEDSYDSEKKNQASIIYDSARKITGDLFPKVYLLKLIFHSVQFEKQNSVFPIAMKHISAVEELGGETS